MTQKVSEILPANPKKTGQAAPKIIAVVNILLFVALIFGLVACDDNENNLQLTIHPDSIVIEVGKTGGFYLNGECEYWESTEPEIADIIENDPMMCVVRGNALGIAYIRALDENKNPICTARVEVVERKEGGSSEDEDDPNKPTNGHKLTCVKSKDPTCLEDGNNEYYTCSHCDKWFYDPLGQDEIIDKTDVIIKASSNYHNFVNEVCTVCGVTKIPDGLNIRIIENRGYFVSNYTGNAAEVVIPSTIYRDGIVHKVMGINSGAFANNAAVTSITIPDQITEIGFGAFSGCENLVKINLPESLKTLGHSAFENCKSLTAIDIPSRLRFIEENTFNGCEKLATITGGENLYNIYRNALEGTALVSEFENGTDEMLYVGNCLYTVKPSITEFNIKDGTVGVSSDIFTLGENNLVANVKSVSIPDSLVYFMSGPREVDLNQNPVASLAKNTEYKGVYYLGNSTNPYVAAVSITQEALSEQNIELHPNTKIICNRALSPDLYNGEAPKFVSLAFPVELKSIGSLAFYATNVKDVTLPDSLIYIGAEAFELCYSLENFNTGNGVEELPSMLFQYCEEIENLTIGRNVNKICSSAFSACKNIKNLTFVGGLDQIVKIDFVDSYANPVAIAQNVTGIGNSIVIPEGTERLNANALIGLKAETISLPASLCDAKSAIEKMRNLKKVDVAAENKTYISINGVLYSADKNFLYFIPPRYEGALVIPKETKEVTVSGSSNGIESITVEAGNETYYADKNCLYRYQDGADEKYLVLGCKNSVIADDVTTIASNAFNNVNITTLKINEGMDLQLAFQNCKIGTLEIDGSIYLDWRAFENSEIDNLKAPAELFESFDKDYVKIKNLKITGTGEGAFETYFSGMTSLESIIIPEGYTALGIYGSNGLFEDCTSLKSVTLPSTLKALYGMTFFGCVNLSEINGGDNLECIDSYALLNTKYIDEISPDEIRYIGSVLVGIGADVTDLTIKEGTTMGIINLIDGESSKVKKLVVPNSMDHSDDSQWIDKYNCYYTSSWLYNLDSLTELDDVTVPAPYLDSLNSYVKQNISKLTVSGGKAKENMLSDFTKLTELDMTGVEELPDGVLRYLGKLEKLVLPFLGNRMNSNEVNLGRLFGKNSFAGAAEVRQTGFGGQQGIPYYIPTSLTSVTVNAGLIGSGAFENCVNLTEIIFGGKRPNGEPFNLMAIGDFAFKGCTGLTSFKIPDMVTNIGVEAFAESGLTSLELINVTRLGQGAFRDCKDLGTVSLGQVDIIGPQTFMGCTTLTSVTIPYTVAVVGQKAFQGCTKLSSVVFEAAPAELPKEMEMIWTVANSVTSGDLSDFTPIDDVISDAKANANKLSSGEWADKQLAHQLKNPPQID